jgi:hypothetical protein
VVHTGLSKKAQNLHWKIVKVKGLEAWLKQWITCLASFRP